MVCGSAAFRAESLWLSVKLLQDEDMPLRRSLNNQSSNAGKAERFRTAGGKAARNAHSSQAAFRFRMSPIES